MQSTETTKKTEKSKNKKTDIEKKSVSLFLLRLGQVEWLFLFEFLRSER